MPPRRLPLPRKQAPVCGALSQSGRACQLWPGHKQVPGPPHAAPEDRRLAPRHRDAFGNEFVGDWRVVSAQRSAPAPKQLPPAGRREDWIVTTGTGKQETVQIPAGTPPWEARRVAEEEGLRRFGFVKSVRPGFYRGDIAEGERTFPMQRDKLGRVVPAPNRAVGLATKRVGEGRMATTVWDPSGPAPPGVDWRDWEEVKNRVSPQQARAFLGAGLTHAQIVALVKHTQTRGRR